MPTSEYYYGKKYDAYWDTNITSYWPPTEQNFANYYRSHHIMSFKKESVSFINVSEIFKHYPLAWDVFTSGEWCFSWGDNSFSLITVMMLKEAVEECEASSTGSTQSELRNVLYNIEPLDLSSFVNLEG